MHANHKHRLHRRPEQGFTLIEIMVVVVILGILATVFAKNIFSIFSDTQEQIAQTKVKNLVEAVQTYHLKYRHYPKSLEQLAEKDEKGYSVETEVPNDPWGHEFILRIGNHGEVEVISCGPDGNEGTEDDISSRPKNAK